jgi:hypothetical protein
MTDDETALLWAEIVRLLAENERLKAELDRANDPTWGRCPDRPRNALETIGDWWSREKGRSMRVSY